MIERMERVRQVIGDGKPPQPVAADGATLCRIRKLDQRLGKLERAKFDIAGDLRLANEGTTQQSRDDFIGLANVWLKLAAQLESDRALLDMLDNAQTFGIRRVA